LQRIDRILQEEKEVADSPGGAAPPAGVNEIRIRRLTFTYPGRSEPALREISLEIPAGKQIVITGRTGSGKSTLAGLLVRLLDPPPGSILLDQTPLEAFSLAGLRSRVSLVPQEPFLFSDTIRANLQFARPGAAEEDLWKVLEAAGLDQEIRQFPAALNTVVGEKGVLLSGGQKQRLTLARALLADPSFLVLDNTLAAVDLATERKILKALPVLRRNQTTVFISHRLVGWEHMDALHLLDEGRLIESGSHAELLKRDGLYAKLYRRQRLERELREGVFIHAAG
jgi:ABC-type multidrug transport system fused ATPase/permease subunit